LMTERAVHLPPRGRSRSHDGPARLRRRWPRHGGRVAGLPDRLIGRAIGVFVDRKEVGEPGEFARLTDDELDREFVKEAELLGLSRERAVAEQPPAEPARKSKSPTRH
jgi:hypothetical protein